MKKQELLNKLQELAEAKQKAIADGNLDKATILRSIEKEVQKELDELERNTTAK